MLLDATGKPVTRHPPESLADLLNSPEFIAAQRKSFERVFLSHRHFPIVRLYDCQGKEVQVPTTGEKVGETVKIKRPVSLPR